MSLLVYLVLDCLHGKSRFIERVLKRGGVKGL